MSDPQRRPNLAPINLGFGLIFLVTGSVRTFQSLRSAEGAGEGDPVRIYWLALILGTALTVAGILGFILRKRDS